MTPGTPLRLMSRALIESERPLMSGEKRCDRRWQRGEGYHSRRWRGRPRPRRCHRKTQ